MQTFEITAPDGNTYEIEGDNEQGALEALKKYLGSSAPGKIEVPTGMSQQDQIMYDELRAKNPEAYEKSVKKPVDSPKFNLNEKALERTGPLAVGANIAGGVLYNAPRNLASTGLAVADYATERMFGFNPGRAESFEATVPEYEPENFGGNVVTGIAEVGAGVAGGLKAGSAVIKNAPQAIKGLSALILGEAGGVATSDIDTETIILEIGKDDNGSFDEQLLNRRLNLLTEAMILTKAGELAIRGGAATLDIVKAGVRRLNAIGNEEAIAKEIADDLLNTLIDIRPTDTPADIARKKREIADILDKHGVVQYGDVTVTRDSMTAIEKGLPDGRSRDLAYARGMRQGTDSPELEARLAEPSKKAEETLFELETKAGGPAKANELAEQIQTDVKGQIKDAGKKVSQTQRRLLNTEKSLEDLLKNDVELGSMLKRLGDKTNIDISTGKNVKANQILEKINKASEKMTKKKNDLFDAIPSNATVDVETIMTKYDEIKDMLPTEFKDKFELLFDAAEGMDEFAEVNFNALVKLVDFDMQNAIGKARNSGEFATADVLKDFKTDLIDRQLDFFINTGQDDVANAALAAKRYYSEEYAPFWRDGRLEDLQYLARENRLRPQDMAVKQRDVLTKTLSDDSAPEYTQAIYDLMSRSDADASQKLLSDYVLSDVTSTAQSIINRKGKFSTDEVNSLVGRLEKFVPILNKADPTQAKRFNKLVDAIRTKEFSAEELTKQLKQFEGDKANLEKELFNKYGDFFTDYGLDKIPRRGEEAWVDIFKDKDILPKLPDIIKQAKKNKNLDGLRAAYSKQFKDQLFRAQEMQGGAKKLNPMKDEDLDRFYQIGDELYKNTPEVMEAVKGLIGEATSLSRNIGGKTVPGIDTSSFRKKASGVADFVITMVWGPLNRTGARIRSASGRILNATDPSDIAKKITGEIMSNPEEFSRLARQLADKDLGKMSPENRKTLFKWVTANGLYAGSEEEWRQAVEESQTENMLSE
jgi:uncharacterized protein (DUF1778 family)